MLQASDTACDDLHKFNPTEFDMQNAMRINLKVGAEAPPPEFRKQGHHMLEIIAAQIKEMEDAGWVFRGKSTTACPIHMVRKPTAPSQESHVRAWERFIKVSEYERLSMTESKILIGVKYMRYLGHIISHSEIFSDPKKVEAIKNMPAPRTKKDCRCWLGCCNYYRPYIVNFGTIARPIIDLTTDEFGKDISQEWDRDPKYQNAFDTLVHS